jgi:four helix bundle protein
VATIERFEQIEAWQEARKLTNALYELTSEGKFARDFGLRDQIRRAAVSVMSNIAERFERGGDKEFIQFLSLAKGSAGDSVTALCCF